MIVVDASLVLGLVLPLPYSELATAKVRELKEAREELFAPALLDYEVCSALRRVVCRGIVATYAGVRVGGAARALQGLRRSPPGSGRGDALLSRDCGRKTSPRRPLLRGCLGLWAGLSPHTVSMVTWLAPPVNLRS